MNFQELVRRPVFVVVAVVVLLVLAALLGGCPEPTEATQTTAQVATEAAQTTTDRQTAQVGVQPVSLETSATTDATRSRSEQAVSVRSATPSEVPANAASDRSEPTTQTPAR